MPFIATVQTAEAGQPVLACFAQAPFTRQAVEEFAAESLARPLTVVSAGLRCFIPIAGAGVHERIVTGGGRASFKLPLHRRFDLRAILARLVRAAAGTAPRNEGFIRQAEGWLLIRRHVDRCALR